MKPHGNSSRLPRLPKGAKVPTGVFEIDEFFGGGLDIGDYVGFVWRGAYLNADVDMLLQLAYAASACASVACFVTPRKEDAAEALQNMSLKDGFPPALDQESAVLLQMRDSLQRSEGVLGGAAAVEHVFPLELVQEDEIPIADVEHAAQEYEVVVIDHLGRLKEAQKEKGLYELGPSPRESAYDQVRSICKRTGVLVIAGSSVYRGRDEEPEELRYGDQEPPLPFDKAVVVDFPLTLEDLLSRDDPLSGCARVRCTDRITGEESGLFDLDYTLGKGFVSSFGRLFAMSSSHSMTDGDESFYGSGAFRLPVAQVGNRSDRGRKPEGAARLDAGIKDWFAREIESRRCLAGGRPFSRHVEDGKLAVDDGALLKGLTRHEEELVLRQPPFSLPVETVLFLLKHDYPELFFVKGIESMERIADFLWLVKPSYRFSPNAAVEAFSRIDEVAGPLLEEARQVAAIDERVGFLHDWLCEHVFCTGGEIGGLTEMDAPFLLGRGSAGAITKAWHYLCDRAGIGAGPTFGAKKGSLAVWSIAAIQPGPYEDCRRETLEFLHYAIAEDVLLSNMTGSTSRMYYGARRDDLLKWGYETPFEFVNEYAPDLREGRKSE